MSCGAVDKTSSSFSAHGKIGNFIIFHMTLSISGKLLYLAQRMNKSALGLQL